MKRAAFPRIGSFKKDDYERQAALLEGNVARKFAEVDARPIAGFTITDVKTSAYTAKFGEMVRVDPTGGTLTVKLPSPSDSVADEIAVVNDSDSRTTITIEPLDADDTVNGASSLEISESRFTRVLHPDPVRGNWIVMNPAASTSYTVVPGKITDYTANTFEIVTYDAITASRTLTTPASPSEGDWFGFNIGPLGAGLSLTLSGNSGATINGLSSIALQVPYWGGLAIYNGTEWRLVEGWTPDGFRLQYALDFTAHSTLNIKTGGDGSKTIDGKTWTWANNANATTAAITNGTGLQINPVANSGSGAPASRLAPILTIPISNLIPDTYNPARHILRIAARVTLSGNTKVAQGVRLGIENATTPKDQGISFFKGWSASAPGAPGGGELELVVQSSKPVATASLTFGTTSYTSNDTLAIDFEAPRTFDARVATYGTAFPTVFDTYVESEIMEISAPLIRLPSDAVLTISAQDSAAAGGGGFTATITHLQVWVKDKFPR